MSAAIRKRSKIDIRALAKSLANSEKESEEFVQAYRSLYSLPAKTLREAALTFCIGYVRYKKGFEELTAVLDEKKYVRRVGKDGFIKVPGFIASVPRLAGRRVVIFVPSGAVWQIDGKPEAKA